MAPTIKSELIILSQSDFWNYLIQNRYLRVDRLGQDEVKLQEKEVERSSDTKGLEYMERE